MSCGCNRARRWGDPFVPFILNRSCSCAPDGGDVVRIRRMRYVLRCIARSESRMVDPLPTLLNEHTWSTIKNSPGTTHHLIPLGGQEGGDLLDWIEQTGHYDVWVAKPAPGPAEDPYQSDARTSGAYSTIRSGHTLVYLADTPGNWFEGNVLDLEFATKVVRIYRYERTITSGDPMPAKLNQATFFSIG